MEKGFLLDFEDKTNICSVYQTNICSVCQVYFVQCLVKVYYAIYCFIINVSCITSDLALNRLHRSVSLNHRPALIELSFTLNGSLLLS